MVRDTAWLGMQGTVAAASLQQYDSYSVNNFLRDHMDPPITTGELLADGRRGLEMCHQCILAADARQLRLAPLVLSLFHYTDKKTTPSRRPHLHDASLRKNEPLFVCKLNVGE
jgi:hypothetical protein